MIGDQHKESVILHAALFYGIEHVIDKRVDFTYSLKMLFRSVTERMTGVVNAVKLAEEEKRLISQGSQLLRRGRLFLLRRDIRRRPQ